MPHAETAWAVHTEAGAPGEEIEITSEMWSAGVAAYENWEPAEEDVEALVAAIFFRMVAAR